MFAVLSTNEILASVPRGNTCAGVNREIIGYLLRYKDVSNAIAMLDIPCGDGKFIDFVNRSIPNTDVTGADLAPPPPDFQHAFMCVDANKPDSLRTDRKFDLITCISGVMEFDSTLAFFDSVRRVMADTGTFIVTNDNLLTVRDRLLYLLSGRFGQYRFTTAAEAPTWKVVTLQNLIRTLGDAGFVVDDIRFVRVRTADWFWLPVAILIFAVQRLYLASDGNGARRWFPFRSMLSRHYILFCRKRGDQADSGLVAAANT